MIEAGFPSSLIDRANEVTDALLHGRCAPRIETTSSRHELEVAEKFSAALLACDFDTESVDSGDPLAMLRTMLAAAY